MAPSLVGDYRAQRVPPVPTRSLPSRPGQVAGSQSVLNSVHTEYLPAPAGSSSSAGQEVWPLPAPGAHTPTRLAKSSAAATIPKAADGTDPALRTGLGFRGRKPSPQVSILSGLQDS